MIWVIGDIHGMFDPLKRLVSALYPLQKSESSNMRLEKIIFMGDYIDHGPSSKEVIDFITELPFETVCLMGNHDDLLLQFYNHDDLIQQYGNVWFRGNGGQRTMESFFPETHYRDSEEHVTRQDVPALDEKYMNFFRNLKITHTERIGDRDVVFTHALPNCKFPLDEQFGLQTYDDFHAWRRENKVWIEDTLLWNRSEPDKRFNDYILVHGHIPTPKLKHSWKDLHEYDTNLELPFFKFQSTEKHPVKFMGRGYRKGYSASLDQLISLDVDTGAVYGNRLTALGLSAESLDQGEVPVYQVSTSRGYRLSEDLHIEIMVFYD